MNHGPACPGALSLCPTTDGVWSWLGWVSGDGSDSVSCCCSSTSFSRSCKFVLVKCLTHSFGHPPPSTTPAPLSPRPRPPFPSSFSRSRSGSPRVQYISREGCCFTDRPLQGYGLGFRSYCIRRYLSVLRWPYSPLFLSPIFLFFTVLM